MENKLEIKQYIELYDELTKYKILKNFIKENIKIDDKGKVETNFYIADDLVKLIKYIDKNFYNELEQQGKA